MCPAAPPAPPQNPCHCEASAPTGRGNPSPQKPPLRKGKSPKRCQWQKKRGDFEEVPRLAGTIVPGNRLARRWAGCRGSAATEGSAPAPIVTDAGDRKPRLPRPQYLSTLHFSLFTIKKGPRHPAEPHSKNIQFNQKSAFPTVRGCSSTSRMLLTPVRYITIRSKPNPKPACLQVP